MTAMKITGFGVLAGLLAFTLVGCLPGDGSGTLTGLSPRPPLALKAALTFRTPLRTQAVAADIHHLTFKLVNASDGVTTVASVDAQPPFASPLTLQLPAPPNGSYRLSVEAFGGAAAGSSLSQVGALLSANTVTVAGLVPTYSSGTAVTFPSQLYLKSGGTIPATVTGAGTNRIDVSVLSGATVLSTVAFSPASFPVTNLPPGTYTLRVTFYTAGGIVDHTVDSAPVTVDGAATGYAADGDFAVAF